VCLVLAAFVFLIGASDEAVHAGLRVFASVLVHRSLPAVVLPPACHVAGRLTLPFHSAEGLRRKPYWGRAWFPTSFLSCGRPRTFAGTEPQLREFGRSGVMERVRGGWVKQGKGGG
jgi:hypothetical protein